MNLIQKSIVLLALTTLDMAYAWEPTKHCGPMASNARGLGEIHIVCPQLDKLTREQIWEAIVDLLNKASSYSGPNQIFFYQEAPAREQKFRRAGEEARMARWGGLLIGHYHSRNGVLMLRQPDNRWTEVRLPPD